MQHNNSVSRREFCNQTIIQFFCHYCENTLHDLCKVHVDDFIHAGTYIFQKTILINFHSSFQIGKSFIYLCQYRD